VAPAPYPCEQVVPIEHEPHHHLAIANDFVRAFAVEIPPDERTLCHHHPHEYLMYVVGDAQIVSAPRDAEPTTHSYRDGDCERSPAGLVHVVENVRDTKFRNLVVEFLPGFGDLRRGPALTTASEDVKMRPCFDDQRASVSRLQMENGSQVEVCGPAILASPHEIEVELTVTQVGPRALGQFIDMAWIEPRVQARLRNSTTLSAKVVLIALGQR
jgi:mannose-6-phosphate isomerase-like protein (cupin superfamily)